MPLFFFEKDQATSVGRSESQSTTSSLLQENFPNRYFVLKSLSVVSTFISSFIKLDLTYRSVKADLTLSVAKGIWATQLHNEWVLDRAYRTSQNVFLIFGANKTRQFFGYARYVG
jgi:hypothetical protein